ncbi:CPBP family intramembrane metalloprotease [Natronolimnobius sp. AArcel1]|uniref:CPBP family intramembrane glutamic endopeptidase n=1 Tax=Natronolimnobius sp. AArcel1 TaxID=1679093 RepID=UPI0013EC92EC|nr:type II CAAX endopeptidase family protein [Natronolimnobius sp. AArcel1]NGM69854.1 CPBP family intramembrane metalloprotease [Natronolimnobius sp. AArcel1]
MTETARADDATPFGHSAVPGIGAALAAVTLAAMAVPIQRGLEDPVVWSAGGFAAVAVLAFLGSRYSVLERRVAALAALASSVGVVLLSGYAMNQGIAASVTVPGLETSISLVFAGFVTAALTAGVSMATFYGLTLGALTERSLETATMSILGFAGLLAAQISTLLIAQPAFIVTDTLSQVELIVISQLGMALGMGGLALAYVSVMDYDWSFIDLKIPTARDIVWTVGGLFVLFGALFAISMLFHTTGVESADHGTTEQAQENPEILLVLIPAAILIIGPFEELLYRNVIQKALYGTFSRYGAVVVGSVIFAVVHTQAYWTAGPGQVVASLGTIFGLSIVLGTIYERTDNLLVPALVHGVYNALLFANLYFLYG